MLIVNANCLAQKWPHSHISINLQILSILVVVKINNSLRMYFLLTLTMCPLPTNKTFDSCQKRLQGKNVGLPVCVHDKYTDNLLQLWFKYKLSCKYGHAPRIFLLKKLTCIPLGYTLTH